jgi:hypothetical protein
MNSFEYPTINDKDGKSYNLSVQTYTVVPSQTYAHMQQLKSGEEVQLISGVDNNPIPGYHFAEGYVTICRVGIQYAEWFGILKSDLVLRRVNVFKSLCRMVWYFKNLIWY